MKGLHWVVRLLIVVPFIFITFFIEFGPGVQTHNTLDLFFEVAATCAAVYWVIKPKLNED